MALPHPPPPDPGLRFDAVDKLYHLAAYALLMGWFHPAVERPLPVAAGLTAMGVGVEVLQGLGGVRWFEWWDMAANAAGVVLGGLAARRGEIYWRRWRSRTIP